MERPLISVITSTYNVADLLKLTANSIREQKYTKIQWIIIDGNSNDGTVDIIKENSDIVSYWKSEKDYGIYDAWNKAIPEINGDWVLFLGAGDLIHDNSVFEKISIDLQKNKTSLLVYGKVIVTSDDYHQRIKIWGEPWNILKDKWESLRPALPPTPSSFINATFFKDENYLFPIKYKIAGDSHLLMKLMKIESPIFISKVFTIMPLGGISTAFKTRFAVLREVKMLSKDFNVKVPFKHRFISIVKLYVYVILEIILPQKKLNSLVSLIKKTK